MACRFRPFLLLPALTFALPDTFERPKSCPASTYSTSVSTLSSFKTYSKLVSRSPCYTFTTTTTPICPGYNEATCIHPECILLSMRTLPCRSVNVSPLFAQADGVPFPNSHECCPSATTGPPTHVVTASCTSHCFLGCGTAFEIYQASCNAAGSTIPPPNLDPPGSTSHISPTLSSEITFITPTPINPGGPIQSLRSSPSTSTDLTSSNTLSDIPAATLLFGDDYTSISKHASADSVHAQRFPTLSHTLEGGPVTAGSE